ncbi:MAG: helix-turn-helix transcriptional regulator [Dethiobacter sp.]|jgi:ArsR family transcriptional regulator|nr:helix-turn-helix transcriptional regulator [Dethiobacter sp.]
MSDDFERCEMYSVDRTAVDAARERAPDNALLARLARTFQALGETNRLKILLSLYEGELCVCELGEVLAMSAPAVCHHLRMLKDLGLVRARRSGKLVYYSLDDDHIHMLLETGLAHVEHSFRSKY